MHRQEISMASIKMVIKTSPQNIVRKSCTSSWLFYIKIQEFYAFFRVHRCMDTIHFSLSHTKQSSVRTEDSSVYILFICFSKYLETVVKVRPLAKSFCYGRVLMASDAFCQKGWDDLYCWFGNCSKR